MIKARSKIHGPYEVLNLNELGEGTPLLTLPYADVQGSQIAVTLTDTFQLDATPTSDPIFWTVVEVGFWGSYQGVQACLKRTQIRSLTGPVAYYLDGDAAFDQIVIKARNMTGGRRGPGLASSATPENGYSSLLNVFVQARAGEGFGKV